MIPITRSSLWPVLHIQHPFIKPRHLTLPQSHSLVLYSAFTCHWRSSLKNPWCPTKLLPWFDVHSQRCWHLRFWRRWWMIGVPIMEVAGGSVSLNMRIASGNHSRARGAPLETCTRAWWSPVESLSLSMRIAGGSLAVLCSEFEGPGPGCRAEQSSKTMLDNRVSASPPPPRPATSRPHASPALNSHHQTQPTRFPSTNGHFDQKKSSGF